MFSVLEIDHRCTIDDAMLHSLAAFSWKAIFVVESSESAQVRHRQQRHDEGYVDGVVRRLRGLRAAAFVVSERDQVLNAARHWAGGEYCRCVEEVAAHRVPALDVQNAHPPGWLRGLYCCPAASVVVIRACTTRAKRLADCIKSVISSLDADRGLYCAGAVAPGTAGVALTAEGTARLCSRGRQGKPSAGDLPLIPPLSLVALRWTCRSTTSLRDDRRVSVADYRLCPFTFTVSRFAWFDHLFRSLVTGRGGWRTVACEGVTEDPTWCTEARLPAVAGEHVLFLDLWRNFLTNSRFAEQRGGESDSSRTLHTRAVAPAPVPDVVAVDGPAAHRVGSAKAALAMHAFSAENFDTMVGPICEAFERLGLPWVASISVPSTDRIALIRRHGKLWPHIGCVCVTHNVGMDPGGSMAACSELVRRGLPSDCWVMLAHTKTCSATRRAWLQPLCDPALLQKLRDGSLRPETASEVAIVCHARLPLFNGYDRINWTRLKHWSSLLGVTASEFGDGFLAAPVFDPDAADARTATSPLDVRDAGRCWGVVPGFMGVLALEDELPCGRTVARGPETADLGHYRQLPGLPPGVAEGSDTAAYRHFETQGVRENKPVAYSSAGWCCPALTEPVHGSFPVGMFFWVRSSVLRHAFTALDRDAALRVFPAYALRTGADGDHTHGYERAIGALACACARADAVVHYKTILATSSWIPVSPPPVAQSTAPRRVFFRMAPLCCFAAHLRASEASFLSVICAVRELSTLFPRIVVACSGVVGARRIAMLQRCGGRSVRAIAAANIGADVTKYLLAVLEARRIGWLQRASRLCLANDSTLYLSSLAKDFLRAKRSGADVWVMCDSLEADIRRDPFADLKRMQAIMPIAPDVNLRDVGAGREKLHQGWHVQSWFRVGMNSKGIAWLVRSVEAPLPTHRFYMSQSQDGDELCIIAGGRDGHHVRVDTFKASAGDPATVMSWHLAVVYGELRSSWDLAAQKLSVHVSMPVMEADAEVRKSPVGPLLPPPSVLLNPTLYYWEHMLDRHGVLKKKAVTLGFVPGHDRVLERCGSTMPSCTPTAAASCCRCRMLEQTARSRPRSAPHHERGASTDEGSGNVMLFTASRIRELATPHSDLYCMMHAGSLRAVAHELDRMLSKAEAASPAAPLRTEVARVVGCATGSSDYSQVRFIHDLAKSTWTHAVVQTAQVAWNHAVPPQPRRVLKGLPARAIARLALNAASVAEPGTRERWCALVNSGKDAVGPGSLTSPGGHPEAHVSHRSSIAEWNSEIDRSLWLRYPAGVWVVQCQARPPPEAGPVIAMAIAAILCAQAHFVTFLCPFPYTGVDRTVQWVEALKRELARQCADLDIVSFHTHDGCGTCSSSERTPAIILIHRCVPASPKA